jgi:4-carboxymuconolactone decarboxylase
MRFPYLKDDQMSAEQLALAQRYRASWRAKLPGLTGALGGPLDAMIRAPELASRISHLSDYFRSCGTLSSRQVEFIVLLSSRAYSCDYEWSAHRPFAEAAGVPPAVADAIANRRKPDGLAADEQAIYDLVTALLETASVPDGIFEHAIATLGERQVAEIAALCGFYSMIAMILAVADVGAPEGGETLPLCAQA